MRLLEPALVAKVWPADRAVCGMLVSKSVRNSLSMYCGRVIIKVRSLKNEMDATEFCRAVIAFQSHAIALELHLSGKRACLSTLLFGLKMAVEKGWHGRLRSLHLSSLDQGIGSQMGHDFVHIFSRLEDFRLLNSSVSCFVMSGAQCATLQRIDFCGTKVGRSGFVCLLPLLAGCVALSQLSLKATSLPDEDSADQIVQLCSALTSLNLSDNKFQTRDGGAWARSLRVCPGLTALDLSSTNTGDSNISLLATHLQACSSLTSLTLAQNEIGDAGADVLGASLSSWRSLRLLDLSNNTLRTAGAAHLVRVGSVFASTLTSLDLRGNFITLFDVHGEAEGALINVLSCARAFKQLDLSEGGLGQLVGAVPGLPSGPVQQVHREDRLTSLNVAANMICGEGLRMLCSLLAGCASLTELDLHGNSLGEAGVGHLESFLRSSTALTRLDLMSANVDAGAAQAASRILSRCSLLTDLRLGQNNLGPHGMQVLSRGIRQDVHLRRLDLGVNRLGAEGARSLSEVLGYLRALEWISLRCNCIGDAGAAHLSSVLPDLPRLCHLDLQWNSMAAAGAFHLACVVGAGACSSLQELLLGGNELGGEGGWLIAGALPACPRLRQLDLEGNNIGDPGATRLAEALGSVPALTELNLSMNDIGAAAAGLLAADIHECRQLKRCDLSWNNMGLEGTEKVLAAAEHCKSLHSLKISGNSKKRETAG